MAAGTVHAGHAAVLDIFFDPRLRLDQHSSARWAAQSAAACVAAGRSAPRMARNRHRGLHRHGLFVPAVHGAAALCHAGEDGRDADRGCCRSRRTTLEGVLAGDAASLAPGRHCGRVAVLHSDRRRICHSRSARGLAQHHDRANGVDRVLPQQRLAGGVRRCGSAALHTACADPRLPTHANSRPCREPVIMRKASWFNVVSLALGLAFLYLPIVILVIYSFNASRLVTVWAGWSLRWYAELANDQAMLEAAWVTLRLALFSASVATVLGTLAAVALVRFGHFRG